MRQKSFGCPTELTVSVLGSKWRVVILAYLKEDVHRFGELKRRLPGISAKVLTQQLRALAREGLVAALGEDRVAREGQAVQRSPPRLFVASPTGITRHHRDEAQIGRMADGRLEAHLHGDSHDRERHDATVTQGELERGADEARHGDLVEDRLACPWRHLRSELKSG